MVFFVHSHAHSYQCHVATIGISWYLPTNYCSIFLTVDLELQVANKSSATQITPEVHTNSRIPSGCFQIGFSLINYPFWGTPIFGNTHLNSFPNVGNSNR